MTIRFQRRATDLSRSFGASNTMGYRHEDLFRKYLDLQAKVTPKNMADVVLSVLWMMEIDTNCKYQFLCILALKLCDIAADGYWHASKGYISTQFEEAICIRLTELENRLKRTGTTRRQ
ncbi:hypothetical protein [Acinetobacter sp.]|uniref:hypothetical protein n=1 Tax=Acinetobacter sp. TaxID=472 RepID=UPI0037533168